MTYKELTNLVKFLRWESVTRQKVTIFIALMGRYKFVIRPNQNAEGSNNFEIQMCIKNNVLKTGTVPSIKQGKFIARYWLIGDLMQYFYKEVSTESSPSNQDTMVYNDESC